MKTTKIFNILIILLFVLVVFAPLVFVNKLPGRISTAENRVLARFPSIAAGDGKFDVHFIKGFEDWFNDNLGFRDKLVKANTLIQYKLFGHLTKSDTLVGNDSWLFYFTPDIIKDYQHLNLPSEQQLAQWGNSLGRINNYLKSKNTPFIVMLCPNKETIYPENYPSTILKVQNISRTDLLVNYFTNFGLDFFTPINSLLEAKTKAVIYSPRYDNAHWNNYGAFIGYLDLMDRVKKYLPNIKVLSWDDFNISTYERDMKVYNAIPFSETDYAFKLKNGNTATQINGVLDGLNLKSNNLCYVYQNSNKDLPRALIIGDSYFYGYLIPDLAESFSQLIFIHTANIDRIESFVNLFKPDIVILENAERMFDLSMPVLMSSAEKFIDYNSYANLPAVPLPEQFGLMWLDYCNKELLSKQGLITIGSAQPTITISGWALDPNAKSTADSIYIKVGDKYYQGTYGIERTSVSDYFKDKSLTNSGFSFCVNTDELIKAGKFSFIIISKDKSYQYMPVEFKVEVK